MKVVCSIITVVLLCGCAINKGVQNTKNVLLLKEDSANVYASAVRWNENYIVTAKHFDNYKNKCDVSTMDLAFIKAPISKDEKISKWSDIHTDHFVEMSGYIKGGKAFRTITGVVVPGFYSFNGSKDYKMVTNLVTQGMSGGAVHNEQKEVVGLIIGHTDRAILLNFDKYDKALQTYSVVLPYESIKKGWIEVKEKIQKNQCV